MLVMSGIMVASRALLSIMSFSLRPRMVNVTNLPLYLINFHSDLLDCFLKVLVGEGPAILMGGIDYLLYLLLQLFYILVIFPFFVML